jgi:hypothetical protein
MKVDVAVVADYANLAEGGKLNVMGMFDRILASSFPTRHAFMVLALRLRVEFDDRDKTHKIEIGLYDEDGHKWGGGTGEVMVGLVPAGGRGVISQILPFPGIMFPKAGEYHFLLLWDGDEKAKVPLTLAQIPTEGSPPSTPPA